MGGETTLALRIWCPRQFRVAVVVVGKEEEGCDAPPIIHFHRINVMAAAWSTTTIRVLLAVMLTVVEMEEIIHRTREENRDRG